MTRRTTTRLRRLERELTAAPGPAVSECVDALLGLARESRYTVPSPSRRDPIGFIESLLARRSNRLADAAERAAAAAASRLDLPGRSGLAGRLGYRLSAVVPVLLSSDASHDRESGLMLIEAAKQWSLVPHAARMLDGDLQSETDLALSAIEACVEQLHDGPVTEPAAFERALAAVLDAASGIGTNGDRRILGVALSMLTPAVLAGRYGRFAETWLDDAPETLQLRLRSALRALAGPQGAARALELIVRPSLRRASAERIGAAVDQAERVSLLNKAHLARRPLRRSALRARLEATTRVSVSSYIESHARSLSGWVDALSVAPQQRTALLEPLLAHPNSDARLAAVIRPAPSLGFDQALDASEPVAHAAALRLALPTRRDPEAGLVEQRVRSTLQRSPHASVRRLAGRMTTREDAAPLALVALRHALARDRSAVVSELADRITREDPLAFALAARLGLADELLGPLSDAMRSGSPRSVASAARTLASARDPRAEKMLSVCATHDDARVRANAIESAAARARRWRKSMPIYRPDDAH
ncbi:MAG: hypothetical protein AAFS11_04040, partial [Planctomycetota bacterium]